MKKIIVLVVVILAVVQRMHAQNPGLPEEKCTIFLQSGKQIPKAKLWEIHDGLLVYEKEGSLHDLAAERIKTISCGIRNYELVHDTLRPVIAEAKRMEDERSESAANHAGAGTSENSATAALPSIRLATDTNYYEWGKQDAKKYYNGTGAFIGGLLTGIAAPIIAAVPPSNPGNGNPNAALYYSNRDYHKGYQNSAHGKKAVNVLAGLGTFLLFVFIASGSSR